MTVDLRKRIVDLGKKVAFAALLLGGVWNRAPAADEFALLKAERIGPLRVGLPAREVARSIDCQPRRGPLTRWEADGD